MERVMAFAPMRGSVIASITEEAQQRKSVYPRADEPLVRPRTNHLDCGRCTIPNNARMQKRCSALDTQRRKFSRSAQRVRLKSCSR